LTEVVSIGRWLRWKTGKEARRNEIEAVAADYADYRSRTALD